MQGSIKRNKQTGKWDFVIDIGNDPVTGKRKQKRKRGFSTKKEAEKALTTLLQELNEGSYIAPEKTTLSVFAAEWFIERKAHVAGNTIKSNRSLYFIHIEPFLGHFKVQDLNPILLQRFVNNLNADSQLSPGSIRKVLLLLKLMMKKAQSLKLIKENPVTHISLPREIKKEMLVWDLKQISYFIQHSKRNRYYTAYLIAIFTGMRKGEILGLRWKDVDFDKKIIYVRQIFDAASKEFKIGAKTSAGVRSIHIPENLIVQLKKELKRVLENKIKQGEGYNDNDLVICTKFGNPIDGPTLSKRFKKHVERIGLPVIRFHDLRHTHVTMLIQQNVNVKVISERVGHSSIQITLNQYSHVLPSMQQEVANKLDNLFDVETIM
ncbi:site-specific integrase [Bacillus toyonensis]|uniref:site-specific integrase n=1 Tax=Bacillus toyonensis TaxID=155322 RepID=UPI00156E47D0|nr:tyrosine-type recombinase/integrase [Bacillus toyonensis]NSL68290.1 site-specific integrase [Bacillus toyonensis]